MRKIAPIGQGEKMKLTLKSGVYYLDISSKQTDSSAVKINQIIPLFLGGQFASLMNAGFEQQLTSVSGDTSQVPYGLTNQNNKYQVSWAEFKNWYCGYIRNINAQGTVSHDLRTITKIEQFRKPKYLTELTPDYLLEFKFWLEQNKKNKFIRGGLIAIDRHISCFKKIVNTAASFGKMPHQNFEGIKKDIRVKKIFRNTFHTEEELRQIASVLSGDLLTAFYLGWQEGLRRGEIAWLYKTDYDSQKHTITIRAKDGWFPKTASSNRTVPLRPASEEAIKASIAAAPKNSPFIINLNGTRTTPAYLSQNYIKKVKEKLPHIKTFMHKLRHTYGSILAQKGVNLKMIAQLMGHSNIMITSKYTHFVDNSKIEASAYIPDF